MVFISELFTSMVQPCPPTIASSCTMCLSKIETLKPYELEESLKIMYVKRQENGYSNFNNHNYYLIASLQLWGLVLVKL